MAPACIQTGPLFAGVSSPREGALPTPVPSMPVPIWDYSWRCSGLFFFFGGKKGSHLVVAKVPPSSALRNHYWQVWGGHMCCRGLNPTQSAACKENVLPAVLQLQPLQGFSCGFPGSGLMNDFLCCSGDHEELGIKLGSATFLSWKLPRAMAGMGYR